MLPFILAAVGGYFIGDSMNEQVYAEGGIVNPKELYEKLRMAESNWQKDDGAEYNKIKKQIQENRNLYFKKLSESESSWENDGAEYKRLIAMRDSFAEGGMPKEYQVVFWETEEDRDTGESSILGTFSLDEAMEQAKKLYYKVGVASVEVIEKNSGALALFLADEEEDNDNDDNDTMARGGRTKSALMRDRAYRSNEPHELKYKRKKNPNNPRYSK